jgi:hypothetical protein
VKAPRVAEIVAIHTLDQCSAPLLVEREPRGAPSVAFAGAFGSERAVLAVALEIAETMRALHARGAVLGPVPPELVYLAEKRDGGIELAGIAPHGPAFRVLGDTSQLTYNPPPPLLPLFATAPMVRGRRFEPADDVCTLAALTWLWASGECPYPGESLLAVLTAAATGALDTFRGSDALGACLSHALAPAAEARPTLPDFASELRALRENG